MKLHCSIAQLFSQGKRKTVLNMRSFLKKNNLEFPRTMSTVTINLEKSATANHMNFPLPQDLQRNQTNNSCRVYKLGITIIKNQRSTR